MAASRRPVSSARLRSLMSRTTLAKPRRSLSSSRRAVVTPPHHSRLPSLRTSQRSSLARPTAAAV